MNITRLFSIKSLINFFILSFQQLGFPIIVYFSTFIIGFRHLIENAKSKIGLSILVTIILGIFSLSLRDFPLDQIIYQLRFFFGPLLLSYFLLSSNFFSRKKIILAFIIWSLIELFYLLFFKSHPFYISSYFENFSNLDSMVRTDYQSGFFRLLGPTLNSSLAGVYTACFFILSLFDYHLLDPNPRESKNSNLTRNFIIASSFLLLILSRSGTGLISLFLLLFFKSIKPLIKFTRSLKLSKRFLILTVLIISITPIITNSFNINESIFYRVSQFYINVMIERKLELIANVDFNLITLLFGLNYTDIISNNYLSISGGDFLLLVFISNFGLFLVIPFLKICWELAESTKIYFIIFLISSIHYGTIFTITGQAIFTLVFLSHSKSQYNYIS